MAVKKKDKKGKQSEPSVPKGPRQKPLPGMEDRAVEALDDAALRYDEVKKARMKLTTKEVDAKKQVADLMHAKKKKHYQHGNIVIDIVPEGEKVKVKVTGLDFDEGDEVHVEVSDAPEPLVDDDDEPFEEGAQDVAEEEEVGEVEV